MDWVMKIGDDEYVLWGTVMDAPKTPIVNRSEAIDRWGEDRVGWVDKHLCSSRARLGETFESRNGRPVAVGGGRLAYHFDTYAEVLGYMLNSRPETPAENIATLEQLRDLAERTEDG